MHAKLGACFPFRGAFLFRDELCKNGLDLLEGGEFRGILFPKIGVNVTCLGAGETSVEAVCDNTDVSRRIGEEL